MKTLQQLRAEYVPILPDILRDVHTISFVPSADDFPTKQEISQLFPITSTQPALKGTQKTTQRVRKPLKVGVVFSGGQAAGGHNVVSGLFDALQAWDASSQLFGFLGGPSGICSGQYKELKRDLVASYRNQGGFDLLGSGRTKIETEEQFTAAMQVVSSLELDGLVIIGGDDSHTNAASLAEYFLKNECPVKVLGVPKTIDCDLKNAYVAASFGFDTACKVYSEMISNIARDALSSQKYYHFIRLMGRSASHITLECALATQANFACIGEEIAQEKKTLTQVVSLIADLICDRADLGKNFGVILVPEGLIEFISEIGTLVQEIDTLLATSPEMVKEMLSEKSLRCFSSLPEDIQKQLLLHRDPHGNVQLSFIETEKLLMDMVEKELTSRQKEDAYKGTFHAVHHFFGYEGRSGFPSNFDCTYCTALGHVAALLIAEGRTGYMCAIQNLTRSPKEWGIGAVPITSLMSLEMRKGKEKAVVQKTFVDLNGKAFAYFRTHRKEWAVDDTYRFVGPMQFYGPAEVSDTVPRTLFLESL